MPVSIQSTTKTMSKYCLFAGCESGKKFGMIEHLHKQPFASKEFPWPALNEEQYDHVWSVVGRKISTFEYVHSLKSYLNVYYYNYKTFQAIQVYFLK